MKGLFGAVRFSIIRLLFSRAAKLCIVDIVPYKVALLTIGKVLQSLCRSVRLAVGVNSVNIKPSLDRYVSGGGYNTYRGETCL